MPKNVSKNTKEDDRIQKDDGDKRQYRYHLETIKASSIVKRNCRQGIPQ